MKAQKLIFSLRGLIFLHFIDKPMTARRQGTIVIPLAMSKDIFFFFQDRLAFVM